LYNSLREAVKAARYGVYPSSLREDVPTSTEIKKLTASDGVELDFFGRSVATNGNMAIVGAPQDDIGSNSNQGSVYIFERNQGEPNNWGEVKKLTASDGAALDGFGDSVAIHGTGSSSGLPVVTSEATPAKARPTFSSGTREGQITGARSRS
jgi:FG-GAP repeat protein